MLDAKEKTVFNKGIKGTAIFKFANKTKTFSACSNNPNDTTDTPATTMEDSVSLSSNITSYADSIKAADLLQK